MSRKLVLGVVAWFLGATICFMASVVWPAWERLFFWLMIAWFAALVLALIRMKNTYARTHRDST